MSYAKQTWVDGAGGGTPVSASRLNYMEVGIEDAGSIKTVRTVGGATTLIAGDAGGQVELNSASTAAVTIPPNVFAVGAVVEIAQRGVGVVTLAAGVGVTIEGATATTAQHSVLIAHMRASNVWRVVMATPAGGSGGGGGAPVDAPFVTLAANAALSAEAVLGSAVILRNVLNNRPAAGVAGRLFDKTDDDLVVQRDNGSSWDLFAIKGLVVQDDGVQEGAGIVTLDFGAGLDVVVAGTEATVTATGGGGGDAIVQRKTTDQDFLNTTTFADVTALALALAANAVMVGELILFVSGDATTGDLKISFSAPAGMTGTWGVHGIQANATTATDTTSHRAQTAFADATVAVVGTIAAATHTMVIVKFSVVNGGNAGTLQLRAAQSNANASIPTVIRAGSYAVAHVV